MRTISLFISFCLFLATAFPAAAMQDCVVPVMPDCEERHHEAPGHLMVIDDLLDAPMPMDCTDMPGCAIGSVAVLVNTMPLLERQLDENRGFVALDHESPHLFPPVEPPIR